jgi:hypothetical protein
MTPTLSINKMNQNVFKIAMNLTPSSIPCELLKIKKDK